MNIQIKLVLLISLFLVNTNRATYGQQSSCYGRSLTTSDTVRVFLVFAEVINDPNYSRNSELWPQGKMPLYPDSYLDTALNQSEIVGKITKLYNEASFGELTVIGDYYDSLIRVDYNTMDMTYKGSPEVLQYLDDSLPSNDIKTVHGYSLNEDFDDWKRPISTFDSFYCQKIKKPDSYIDMLCIIWRVNTELSEYTGSGNTSGTLPDSVKGKAGINFLINYTDWELNQWGSLRHEMAHNLLGGNSYHTAGQSGGMIRTTLSKQGGYSLLNYADGACGTLYNGFDRWRLGWKLPSKQYYISALDATTHTPVNTDLVYVASAPYHDYILRDFVTTGDVIRIKLPYLDTESSLVRNQYLWLENHQMVSDLDINKREAKGIYAYIQVGYDDTTLFLNGSEHYLTFLHGLGNYDITYDEANKFYINSDRANPFTGNSIIQAAAFNLIDSEGNEDIIFSNEVIYAQGFLWFKQMFFEIFLCKLIFQLIRSPSLYYSTKSVENFISDGINY